MPTVQVKLPTEEVDDVAALRPAWRKLRKLASDISTDLHGLQASLRRPLPHPGSCQCEQPCLLTKSSLTSPGLAMACRACLRCQMVHGQEPMAALVCVGS